MKKIILALSLITILGCNPDTIQKAAHERSLNEDPSLNIRNNVIESLSPNCETAQDVVKFSNGKYFLDGVMTSTKYECLNDNNLFNNLNGETIWKGKAAISIFAGTLVTLSLFLILLGKNAALMEQERQRTINKGAKFVRALATGLVISLLSYIVIYVLGVSIGWASAMNDSNNARTKYKEASAPIPNFSVKSGRMINIVEYLICVKAKNLGDSHQDPSIKFFKASWGVGYKASYEICDLEGGIAFDTRGIALGQTIGFDYESFQTESIIRHLSNFIKDADQIATTYSKGLHGSLMTYDFKPEGLGCDIGSLTSVDTTYFNARQLEKYKVYANDCRSQELVFQLVKANGMTRESIEQQEKSLNHRNIQVCSGTYEDKPMLTKDEQKAVYKACIAQNCTDSGSPYACGTALNKYAYVTDDRFQSALLLPISDPTRRSSSNDSAETMVNSLNARFSFLDNRIYFQNVADVISSVSVSNKQGDITISEVKKAFDTGDKSYLEKAMSYMSFEKILAYFNTSDGFAGTQRFIDCLQHPNAMYRGFDCGSNFEEMQRYGMTLTATALQLKLGNSLYNSPVKRAKAKANDFQLAAAEKSLSSMFSEKVTKRSLAMFIPVISDGVGLVAGEKVFGSKYYEMTGQKGEFYALMALVAISPDASKLVGYVSTAMFSVGQLFIYMLPLMDYFNFIAVVSVIFLKLIFNSTTIQLQWIMNLDTKEKNKDIDRSPSIIYLEELLLSFPSLVSAYLLAPKLFTATFIFVTGNLNEFSSNMMSLGTVVGATFIASFVAVFVVIMTYSICSSFYGSFKSFVIAKYHGEVTKADLKAQGADEMKAMARAYKGKV